MRQGLAYSRPLFRLTLSTFRVLLWVSQGLNDKACLRWAQKWSRVSPWRAVQPVQKGVVLQPGVPQGMAVQVEPMKPTLKAPGTKRVETKIRRYALKFCFQLQLAPLHQGGVEDGDLRMLLGQMLTGSWAEHSAHPDGCEGGLGKWGGMGRRYINQYLYVLQNKTKPYSASAL